MPLKIFSPDFENNQEIPAKFTCQGENINPEIQITGVPEGTNSMLLLVIDPDSQQKTWLHWCMYDIHPDTTYIPQNCPENYSKQTLNDFGNMGYGGPCPPKNKHQYTFQLYALKSKLGLRTESTLQDILFAIDEEEIIETAEIIGYYQKFSV